MLQLILVLVDRLGQVFVFFCEAFDEGNSLDQHRSLVDLDGRRTHGHNAFQLNNAVVDAVAIPALNFVVR